MNGNFNTGFEVVDFGKKKTTGAPMNKYNMSIHYDPTKEKQTGQILLSMAISNQIREKKLTNVLIVRNNYTGELTLVFNKEGNGATFYSKTGNATINNSGVVKYIVQNLGYDLEAKVDERISIGENKALDEEYMAFTISRQK